MPAFDYRQAIQHLGGAGALKVMLNARDLVYSEKEGFLRFKFSGNSKANLARISLNGKDLYDVALLRQRAGVVVEVVAEKDIYAEDLKAVFERLSGLRLGIPRIVGLNA